MHKNAMEMLKALTHLSLKLKYNPIGFNEMLLHPEKSPNRNKKNVANNNKAYLIEYLQMQQTQFQHAINKEINLVETIQSTDQNNSGLQIVKPNNSILDHLQSTDDLTSLNKIKKSIGSIPPLPQPSSVSSQTRNKSKEFRVNFKPSTNGLI